MKIINRVILTRKAERNLKKVPDYIAEAFQEWFDAVEFDGMRAVRQVKSYHDEPLQGKRFGQRSVRLSRSYRAFYVEKNDGVIELIQVLEINKHDY